MTAFTNHTLLQNRPVVFSLCLVGFLLGFGQVFMQEVEKELCNLNRVVDQRWLVGGV